VGSTARFTRCTPKSLLQRRSSLRRHCSPLRRCAPYDRLPPRPQPRNNRSANTAGRTGDNDGFLRRHSRNVQSYLEDLFLRGSPPIEAADCLRSRTVSAKCRNPCHGTECKLGRSDCVRSFGSGRCGYGRGGLHADPPLRNSNEISVFLKLVERLDSLDAETAFAGIDAFVERVRTDPAFRLQLAQRGIVDGLREIASLLQFLEHFSTLVVTERVTERSASF